MDSIRYLPNVTTLEIDYDACVGCGTCEQVCPQGVFSIVEKKAAVMDRDGCMECGACALNCPADALNVSPGVGCASYIIKTWVKGRGNAACC